MFVFFIEAIATVSLNIAVDTDYAGHIVWFIILFPTLIVFLFFGTLWTKRESLYAPMDYGDPQTFQELLRPFEQKVDQIAAKQEAAEIDPVTTELDPDGSSCPYAQRSRPVIRPGGCRLRDWLA